MDPIKICTDCTNDKLIPVFADIKKERIYMIFRIIKYIQIDEEFVLPDIAWMIKRLLVECETFVY